MGSMAEKQRREGHYRLDLILDPYPALDDTSSMEHMVNLVNQDQKLQQTIQELAQRLFATLFYFELTEIPYKLGTRFIATGNLLCVRKANDPALSEIYRRLCTSTISVNGVPTMSIPIIDRHGNICHTLSFTTGELLRIELAEHSSSLSFPLSGLPTSVTKLIARSRLKRHFGCSTHKRLAVDSPLRHQVKRRRLLEWS